jgi:hypothetical protein
MTDWDNLVEPTRGALEALLRKGDAMADRIEKLEALYAAAKHDAQEAEAYAEELEAAFVNQSAATKRLRRKLEILKLDASKARGQLFHDLQECIALMDIIGKNGGAK